MSLVTAQVPVDQNDVMVKHAKFRSIAEELVGDFHISQGKRLVVALESQQQKTAFENILLEALKARGATGRLWIGGGHEEDSVLRVAVLAQEVVRSDLGEGNTRRTTEVIVDARIEIPAGEVLAQKVFRRSVSDTLRADVPMQEMTVVERLLEPAIVIAGAILVVYLLFTVRSS